ncbi:MAG: zinc-dependent metalloprotease [Pseudomonadota bacterium]
MTVISTPVQASTKTCEPDSADQNTDSLFEFRRIKSTTNNGPRTYFGFVYEDRHIDKEYLFVSYIESSAAPIASFYRNAEIFYFAEGADGRNFQQRNAQFAFDEKNPIHRAAPVSFEPLVFGSPNENVSVGDGFFFAQFAGENFFGSLHSWLTTSLAEGLKTRPADLDMEFDSRLIEWRNYSKNISLVFQTDVTLNGRYLSGATPVNASGSKFSIVTRHDIFERPSSDYKPRTEDPRAGFFHTNSDRLSSLDREAADRFIKRWRLEKKDPTAALSKPVKPITFWIENTTPLAFRPYVEAGVLAWNEAFEAAGFKNALEVNIQPDDAEWGSGDIECNVIRWVASPEYEEIGNLGFGPSAHDPLTGEIIAADIRLSYLSLVEKLDDWRRFEGQPAPVLIADAPPVADIHSRSSSENANDALAGARALAAAYGVDGKSASEVDASQKVLSPLADRSADDSQPIDVGYFEEAATDPTLVERMTAEIITDLTMHEVGHVLGLKHNFRASRWRSIDDIHDRSVTQGLISASVMDYHPINFAPSGTPQGDFANTRVGPYDIWAIRFGYDPALDDPDAGENARRTLLAQAAQDAALARFEHPSSRDPRGLRWDLTDQPAAYAAQRLTLMEDVAERLEQARVTENWREASSLFDEIWNQRSQAAQRIAELMEPYRLDYAASSTDGVPIAMASRQEQDQLLAMLDDHVFSPDALQLSPAFLETLGPDVWAINSDNFPYQFSAVMKSQVIARLVNKGLLMRMLNASTFGDSYSPRGYLSALVDIVYGADLSIIGRPNAARREQQVLFATRFADVMRQLSYDPKDERSSYDKALDAKLAATIRPVLTDLRRDLIFDWPWLDVETKAHREELRRIFRNADY